MITQTQAIMNYLGAKCNMLPSDPLQIHKGEKIVAYLYGDCISPYVFILNGMTDAEKKECMIKNCEEGGKFEQVFCKLADMIGDSKFICSDRIC